MLEQMAHRLRASGTFFAAINTVLDDVMALHGAEYGNLQLGDQDELIIVAHRKLPAAFIELYGRIKPEDMSASGRALRTRSPTIISDVEKDRGYYAFLEAARLARYRSIQSTPLISGSGSLIGVVSTLFVNPHEPTRIEMDTLIEYSVLATDHLLRLLKGGDIASLALEMRSALLRRGASSQQSSR